MENILIHRTQIDLNISLSCPIIIIRENINNNNNTNHEMIIELGKLNVKSNLLQFNSSSSSSSLHVSANQIESFADTYSINIGPIIMKVGNKSNNYYNICEPFSFHFILSHYLFELNKLSNYKLLCFIDPILFIITQPIINEFVYLYSYIYL